MAADAHHVDAGAGRGVLFKNKRSGVMTGIEVRKDTAAHFFQVPIDTL